jgi:hypothetical protein
MDGHVALTLAWAVASKHAAPGRICNQKVPNPV